MPREIISLHVGQCGNQIGAAFWRTLCAEHGIDVTNGSVSPSPTTSSPSTADRKDMFFYQTADDERYVPRAVLIDLEPGVIDKVLDPNKSDVANLFNRDNVYKGNSGAGNVWSVGYAEGQANEDAIFAKINREAEGSDSLQGFFLTHSIAGGTGSGCGSFLLEKISDAFPKKIMQTYSMFPASGVEGNSAPYNSILTLKRLALHADSVVAFDNKALDNLAKMEHPSHGTLSNPNNTNSLVARVMAASTSTLRFPSYMYNDLNSICASLIPTPSTNFLLAAYTPIGDRSIQSKHGVERAIISSLLQNNNAMASFKATESGRYISILNIIQGGSGDDTSPSKVHEAMQWVRSDPSMNRNLRFVPWAPPSFHVVMAKRSPYLTTSRRSKISGLMLANHTNMADLLKNIHEQYKTLSRRFPFTEEFKKIDPNIIEHLGQASEIVESVRGEYRKCNNPDFSSL